MKSSEEPMPGFTNCKIGSVPTIHVGIAKVSTKMNLGSTGMRYIHLMQGYYRMLACMYGVYTMIGVEKSLQNRIPFVRMLSHPIL